MHLFRSSNLVLEFIYTHSQVHVYFWYLACRVNNFFSLQVVTVVLVQGLVYIAVKVLLLSLVIAMSHHVTVQGKN